MSHRETLTDLIAVLLAGGDSEVVIPPQIKRMAASGNYAVTIWTTDDGNTHYRLDTPPASSASAHDTKETHR